MDQDKIKISEVFQYFPHDNINDELIFPVIKCAKILGFKSPYSWTDSIFLKDDYVKNGDKRINWISEYNLYVIILSSKEPIIKEFAKWLCNCSIKLEKYYDIDWEKLINYLTRPCK